MSFNQSGLTLYDLVDLLSAPSNGRGHEERGYRQRGTYHELPGYPLTAPVHGYPGYYYAIPTRQGSYYEPTYFLSENDHEEDESQHKQRASIHQGRLDNPLAGLLDIIGSFKSGLNEQEDTQKEKEGNIATGTEEGADVTEEGGKGQEKLKASSDQGQPTSSGKSVKFVMKDSRETPSKRKLSTSHVHPEGPSSVPDPLQVSKPEIRLDMPFSPEINVYDTEKEYHVVLALPGANSKSFSVDYHPSSHELQVKGTVDHKKVNLDPKQLKISELKTGAFERTIKFPALPRIVEEEVKASYSNGLLHIKVPKILNDSSKPKPKRRIIIEDLPDEELEFEKNPNPIVADLD